MNKFMGYWRLLCTVMTAFNFSTLLHHGTGTQHINIIGPLDLHIQFISGPGIGSLRELGQLLQGILMVLFPQHINLQRECKKKWKYEKRKKVENDNAGCANAHKRLTEFLSAFCTLAPLLFLTVAGKITDNARAGSKWHLWGMFWGMRQVNRARKNHRQCLQWQWNSQHRAW